MNYVLRVVTTCAMLVSALLGMTGQNRHAVVADSLTHTPLPGASIFDSKGGLIGISTSNGRTPHISPSDYPITIRYLGFKEKTVTAHNADSIFLIEAPTELPEVEIASPIHKVMHVLGYIREYSTLSTYTDTVFLFREKMVDYMLNPPEKSSFKGWTNPRVIKAKSYYHLTNALGMDTVSDESNYHFSWSDWVGVGVPARLPPTLQTAENSTDTIRGKYSPTEVWMKNDGRITVDIDILADSVSRKWVPNLSNFFRRNIEFENFRLRYNYDNIGSDSVMPIDLTGYSFNIESNGRGHGMFMFNRVNEPFFVSTYAEVYIIDKEFITIKEARQWQRCRFDNEALDIYRPGNAPELQPSIQLLIQRVNGLDKEGARLALAPDHKIGYQKDVSRNFQFGHRALSLLKQLTGITSYKFHKKTRHKWREFRKQRIHENQKSDTVGAYRNTRPSARPQLD